MWYREIVFCVVTFGNRIVLRRLFLHVLLEEPSMSVIHLMNEKSGNMANCPIKFHNSERKYSSASVKRLFSTAMPSK